MPIAGNTSFQAPAYPHPNGPNRSEAPPESRMDLRSGSAVKPSFQPKPGMVTPPDFATSTGLATSPMTGGGPTAFTASGVARGSSMDAGAGGGTAAVASATGARA